MAQALAEACALLLSHFFAGKKEGGPMRAPGRGYFW
jgi:hypothetical protein